LGLERKFSPRKLFALRKIWLTRIALKKRNVLMNTIFQMKKSQKMKAQCAFHQE